ncbi:hypothetical protein LTR17_010356 [Elasticomyces elasticus]|nr:hypothetical protein LTR17_010356 [Elasticomyces elasticus]
MTGGSGLSLRADQVATLLQSVLSSPSETASATQVTVTVTPSATADPSGLYTRTNMVALGAGLGVPLFLALCFCGFMLLRERQKHAKPKLMYKLPDSCKDEFTFRPPPIPVSPYTASSVSDANSRASFRTTGSQKPEHQQSWLQRYETMAQRGQIHEKERHELDTGFAKELPRHELPDRRVSRDG